MRTELRRRFEGHHGRRACLSSVSTGGAKQRGFVFGRRVVFFNADRGVPPVHPPCSWREWRPSRAFYTPGVEDGGPPISAGGPREKPRYFGGVSRSNRPEPGSSGPAGTLTVTLFRLFCKQKPSILPSSLTYPVAGPGEAGAWRRIILPRPAPTRPGRSCSACVTTKWFFIVAFRNQSEQVAAMAGALYRHTNHTRAKQGNRPHPFGARGLGTAPARLPIRQSAQKGAYVMMNIEVDQRRWTRSRGGTRFKINNDAGLLRPTPGLRSSWTARWISAAVAR